MVDFKCDDFLELVESDIVVNSVNVGLEKLEFGKLELKKPELMKCEAE